MKVTSLFCQMATLMLGIPSHRRYTRTYDLQLLIFSETADLHILRLHTNRPTQSCEESVLQRCLCLHAQVQHETYGLHDHGIRERLHNGCTHCLYLFSDVDRQCIFLIRNLPLHVQGALHNPAPHGLSGSRFGSPMYMSFKSCSRSGISAYKSSDNPHRRRK